MKKRYLFFLRHYNDIDNIAPAIYYFLRDDIDHIADVVMYFEDYDYRKNNNFIFLKKEFGERFSYNWFGSYYGFNPESYFNKLSNNSIVAIKLKKTKWFFSRAMNWLSRNIRFINFIFYKNKIFEPSRNKKLLHLDQDAVAKFLRLNRYGKHEDNKLIDKAINIIVSDKCKPSLVVFDVVRTNEVIGITDALRRKGVKRIICLPVSPLINYNTLRAKSFVDIKSEYFKEQHDYSAFDAIGYVDSYYVDSYNKTHKLLGIKSSLKGKTASLGSIRYCPSWINLRASFTGVFNHTTKRTKVAFLPSHIESNVCWEEVERIMHLLSLFHNYEVIVKHHTRDNSKRLWKNSYKNISCINEVDSSALIEWADVVLFWSTSVAIEGYIKKKTMICLSYVVGNKNLYDLYDAGYVVRCRDDLHEFLELYDTEKDNLKYNNQGISDLLDEVIVPGGDKVITNYLSFMECNEVD